MIIRCVFALVVVLGSRLAHADEPRVAEAQALRTRGEELARRGEYAEAIAQFKAADRASPRAAHACLIGLAYLRRALWPQAELFLARCERRRTASDPAPEWLDEARAQLAAGLAGARVTAVDVRVEPAGVAAVVRVSAFPDEAFDPQPIHLPAGKYTLEIAAPGFATATRELAITGTGSELVEVHLETQARRSAVIERAAPVRGPWAMRMAVGSGVALVGAVALHVLAVRTRGELEAAGTLADYRARETTFEGERASAISLYGIAAITGVVAVYLRARRPGVEVGASVTGERAMVTLGWQR